MRSSAFDYPEDPYPGGRPPGSFVIDVEARILAVEVAPSVQSGWTVGGMDLDRWLKAAGAPVLEQRLGVLSYGSNACPAKQMRMSLRLPVVSLSCWLIDHAAVWSAGHRRDGVRPATLARMPGHREHQVISMIDPEDLSELDSVEGNPNCYRREPMPAGSLVLENGEEPAEVLVYVGQHPRRSPLLVNGKPALVFAADGSVTDTPEDPLWEETG